MPLQSATLCKFKDMQPSCTCDATLNAGYSSKSGAAAGPPRGKLDRVYAVLWPTHCQRLLALFGLHYSCAMNTVLAHCKAHGLRPNKERLGKHDACSCSSCVPAILDSNIPMG